VADFDVLAESTVSNYLANTAAHCISTTIICFLSLTADFQSPGQVADFDVLAESFMRGDEQQGEDTAECLSVEVHNPAYDYIPPHLISLFVTDTGGYTPAYVYR
jgi:translation initiation factor 2B subunit (eIF-2B alpha/beta/delta family)